MTTYHIPKTVGESVSIPAKDTGDSGNDFHHVTLKDPDLKAEKRFLCEQCGRWERSAIRFEFEPCSPSTSSED